MQAFRPLQRYFDFSGRSGRAEYWQYIGLVVAAVVTAALIDFRTGMERGTDTPFLAMIVIAVNFIPYQAVTVRRLHDRGQSGKILAYLWATQAISALLVWIISSDPYGTLVPLLRLALKAISVAGFLVAVGITAYTVLPGDPVHNAYGAPDAPAEGANPLQDLAKSISAAPRPFSRPAASMDDAFAAIEKLGKLKEQGLITEEEFAAQKARLLNPHG